MNKRPKHLVPALLLLMVAALVVIAFRPRPVMVETGRVEIGALQETVEGEGETRAHDRYTVAAPVTGRLMRIELHEGDRVRAGQAVAFMRPAPLDDRERDAAAARVGTAEALLRAAEEQAAHDRSELEQTRRELERTEKMASQGIATAQALEQARTALQLAGSNLAAADFRARAAKSQLKEARAALLAAEPEPAAGGRIISVRVPRSGPVLRILEKSERVVTAGTPLLMVGDSRKLEVVVDLLSSDAVRVRSGADVLFEEWGGKVPLRGRVRVVEPYAFTKVSALGIEEQRVNIIADLLEKPEALGDGYRVMARIITWAADKTLKMPVTALFRQGEQWGVYVVEHGRAARRIIEIGHRGRSDIEIISGVKRGDIVVLHPANQLDDGMRVKGQ